MSLQLSLFEVADVLFPMVVVVVVIVVVYLLSLHNNQVQENRKSL